MEGDFAPETLPGKVPFSHEATVPISTFEMNSQTTEGAFR